MMKADSSKVWFIYVWLSIGAGVAAETLTIKDRYTVNNCPSLCDTKSFLAIRNSKKQYKVFDSGNLMIHGIGPTWNGAEEICQNMTFCSRCFLPEPKDKDENEILINLADLCGVENPFLGLGIQKSHNNWIWRSEGDIVNFTSFKPLSCDQSRPQPSWSHDILESCSRMVDKEWCEVDCLDHARSFICEMKPSTSDLTDSIETEKPEPEECSTDSEESTEESTEDLPLLTIVAIGVGSLVGLVVLYFLIALCCCKNPCFCCCGKGSKQQTENTELNAVQDGMGAPQTQQYPGNFSQPPGTELANAQGQTGPAYAQGQQGPTYTQGQPGPVYTQGQPGPTYSQGQPGPTFSQGQPGPTYFQGQPGPTYSQGQPGPVYYQAQPGTTSSQGQRGSANTQGSPESAYLQGESGSANTKRQTGDTYAQSSRSASPANTQVQQAPAYTQAPPGPAYIQVQPSPYYTQGQPQPGQMYPLPPPAVMYPPPPPAVMYPPPPIYRNQSSCIVS